MFANSKSIYFTPAIYMIYTYQLYTYTLISPIYMYTTDYLDVLSISSYLNER
jgi:hypothetical protein